MQSMDSPLATAAPALAAELQVGDGYIVCYVRSLENMHLALPGQFVKEKQCQVEFPEHAKQCIHFPGNDCSQSAIAKASNVDCK